MELYKNVIVSLHTRYRKSLIFHLCGPLLRKKSNHKSNTTTVISPLNLIQKDQFKSLQQHGISACRMDVVAHAMSEERVKHRVPEPLGLVQIRLSACNRCRLHLSLLQCIHETRRGLASCFPCFLK